MIDILTKSVACMMFYILSFFEEMEYKYYEKNMIKKIYGFLNLIFFFNCFIVSIPFIILVFILKLFIKGEINDWN